MTFKSFLTAAFLASTSAASVVGVAQARDVVIGLSPKQSPAQLKDQVQSLVEHVLNTVEPDEHARFFDAWTSKLIAEFEVPNEASYRNPKAKIQANRRALGQLKRFIDSARPEPGREAAVNLPTFLRAIRRNYKADGGMDMIVYGSPVADDPKSPSLSMRGARVPNDGHVAAHAAQSPYGTANLAGSLEGYDIYMGLIGPDWSVSSSHAYQTERFWSLSVEGHGGSLQYFGDDLQTLLSLAGADAPDISHAEPLTPTDKLEMIQFARDEAQVADIFTQPLEVQPAPEPVWKAARNPRIGITWIDAPEADLDLYVRPTPAAPVIFFGQSQTPNGTLFKDFTNSPSATNGFETVALNGTYDLSAVRLAVNFYGGAAPNGTVTGELRIAIGDGVWAKTFTIDAGQGNRSEGAETVMLDGVAPNAQWVVIDPLSTLSGE